MSQPYLIDGYNLLYAMGGARPEMGPMELDKSRRRLLGSLLGAFGEKASDVTVVFDAAGAPPDVDEAQNYRGVQVRYAVHHAQADDLIEELIRKSSAPKQLTVISDDRRVQKAARRRHCRVHGCQEFLDWLARQSAKRRRQQPETPEKRSGASERETAEWLETFGDLDHDKDMKELFDPFDFK